MSDIPAARVAAPSVERVGELIEIARKATPGPWRAYTPSSLNEVWGADNNTANPVVHWTGFDATLHTREQRQANAKHIAAFDPPTCIALLEEVARLKAALEPFAAIAHLWRDNDDRKGIAFTTPNLSPSDFRRARQALTSTEEG